MEKFQILSTDDYLAAKARFAELFHSCPCITDEEEGMMLFEVLEAYEKKLNESTD